MPDLSMSKLLESLAIFVGKMYTTDARGIDADIYERGPGDTEFSIAVVADEPVPYSRLAEDERLIFNFANATIPHDSEARIHVDVVPVTANIVDARIRVERSPSTAPLNDDKDL